MSQIIPIKKTVQLESGPTQEVVIREIRLRDYEEAHRALLEANEFRLVELSCDQKKDWALLLTPESYAELAELAATPNGVNARFFAWRARSAVLREIGALLKEEMRRQIETSRSTPSSATSPPA